MAGDRRETDSRMDEDDDDSLDELEASGHLELVGELDAHAAEALRLQIRRLARQHGIDLVEMRVEPDADEQPSG